MVVVAVVGAAVAFGAYEEEVQYLTEGVEAAAEGSCGL